MAAATPLHQELGNRLAGLIRAGTFPAGSRFPSIRRTSREHRVSISTVIEAYRQLEDEGLIRPRPRSGYFVEPPRISPNRMPGPTAAVARPIRPGRSSIIESILDHAGDPSIVPFATAAPGDGIVPESRLAAISREVMKKYGAGALRYTPPQGRRELRAALARRMFEIGLKVEPDEIVTTQGATEGLQLALSAVARPGDLVAVESPCYFGTLNLLRDLGLRMIEIPVDPQSGVVIEALASALKKHAIAACVLQPHFHNPIGALMPESRKREFAELAEAHGFTVIEDDVYGDLAHDGRRPPSVSIYGARVIHCGSVSKTIAPGLRVGWMVPGMHLDEVRRLKSIRNPWNGTLSELIIAGFLDAGGYDRHLRRIRGLYAAQCGQTREAVLRHFPDCARVSQPAGGFVLWVEMPTGFDAGAFGAAALGKRISISPGPIFSASGGLNQCFRLSCGFAFGARTLEAITVLGKLAPHFLS